MQSLAVVQVALTLLLFAAPVLADCECGYQIADSNDTLFFTNFLNNTFAKAPDTTDDTGLIDALPDWEVQEWGVPADPHNDAPLARQNRASNVWMKAGELHLRQPGWSGTGNVSVAELHSKVSDIFHGSFRMRYRVEQDNGGKGGAVAGMFFYWNDSTETDIEILTNDGSNFVRYTNHPSVNLTTGDVINGTLFKDHLAKPRTANQEQRFDWSSDVSRFYQDNILVQEIRKNVPAHDGTMMINVWSNGGSWSGPPATKNVTMSISYINLYYNTTASDRGADDVFNKACAGAGGPSISKNTLCTVDENNKSSAPATSQAAPPQLGWCIYFVLIAGIANFI